MSDSVADILIVDDHPMMRRALAQLLALESQFNVVGEASSGLQAIDIATQCEPDLILMDLNMPNMNGIETIAKLRELGSDARIMVFTVSDDQHDIQRALKAGADGYVLKDMEPEVLVQYIGRVLSGETVLSEQLNAHLVNALKSDMNQGVVLSELTDREQDVLHLIAQGCSNKVIARQLDITEGTVKVHVKRLLSKMNMRSRVEAAVWVVENKIFLGRE